jgi:hypothetical protein
MELTDEARERIGKMFERQRAEEKERSEKIFVEANAYLAREHGQNVVATSIRRIGFCGFYVSIMPVIERLPTGEERNFGELAYNFKKYGFVVPGMDLLNL